MKKKLVLKTRFGPVMKRARVVKKGGVSIFLVPGTGKVGVATSVKGAVNRNRIKRRLREFARLVVIPQLGSRNAIIIANNETFRRTWIDLG